MKFERAFYCRPTQQMATSVKRVPASFEQGIHLWGTKVRERLRKSEVPPLAFSRTEVAAELARAMQVLVDA